MQHSRQAGLRDQITLSVANLSARGKAHLAGVGRSGISIDSGRVGTDISDIGPGRTTSAR
jgi:hypothetical protein